MIVSEAVKCIGEPKQWFSNCHLVVPPNPVGYLKHEPTGCSLAVYKPISRFHALMLRWCFGVKFEKI
ncbi:hypothetical protein [Muribaculum intestinale]|uniref:hypothetical protein n=1 Tax=Muribaculum intestinale TaxID=1796646 RepID=UPI0025B6EFAE|nr:hypothetical protein [Muribaculum intestinale]